MMAEQREMFYVFLQDALWHQQWGKQVPRLDNNFPESAAPSGNSQKALHFLGLSRQCCVFWGFPESTALSAESSNSQIAWNIYIWSAPTQRMEWFNATHWNHCEYTVKFVVSISSKQLAGVTDVSMHDCKFWFSNSFIPANLIAKDEPHTFFINLDLYSLQVPLTYLLFFPELAKISQISVTLGKNHFQSIQAHSQNSCKMWTRHNVWKTTWNT